MYLVNRAGRVIEAVESEQISALLSMGMREANVDEVKRYKEKKKLKQIEQDGKTHANSIYFSTVKSSADGYGMSRDKIISAMFKEGIYLSENYTDQKVGLIYGYPHSITSLRTDVRLIYTMFESDKIPEDWPEYLNQADEVLVPSKFCHDVFKKAGVDSTIVPLGYAAETFKYIERSLPAKTGRPFTFIHYNSFEVRKGFMEVVKAFDNEFDAKENVKLILKTNQHTTLLPFNKAQYPNIEVVTGDVTEGKLAEIIERADCMVYPSRGEGFGITPLEAMATGIPAIVPNAHGISEYFNDSYMLGVESEPSPALYNRFKGQDVGNFVTCDIADIQRQMRFAFTHQEQMQDLGAASSQYVKRYTYKQTASQLSTIIRKWQRSENIRKADNDILRVVEL